MVDLKLRTKQYALRIIRLYSTLPNTVVAQVIGKQLMRSGTSVGANYREAVRARSRAEFISKANISLQELDETAYWLELLRDSVNPDVDLAPLIRETDELTAIFVIMIKNAKAKRS
ncbi:MAG TPA: four helix bundle protein [Candidatus Edwardsbacteria bacterium]|nr:four helix bundle protein [Candidatus Edwardsbacteria bacterium]